MFNETLARETLERIREDEETWHQGMWIEPINARAYYNHSLSEQADPITVCGAKLCFAGHAVLAAGWKLPRDAFSTGRVVNPANGQEESIANAASKELGLDTDFAQLFDALNTLEMLEAQVDWYAEGRDEVEVIELTAEQFPFDDEDDDF